ncbi:MAG: glycine cleavage system protein H [Thermodesulfobacterium geofontis]|uniref:Glycine cleavage system protein H n=1 Tax=Thermodesulfobacterium geofontis TaxID=1295609 RepID=A0A2N7QFY6_9BACT|nr:MAG: glycine cleavage system protein H [Thermodesulfobacterium geofontis]PMP97845.1 MAG: glycine cleavage system protein H [Thermodesulfobacterium geofontis]
MFKLPEDRLYSENHLWVKKKKKKLARIGLTDYFNLKNWEIIDIDLPEEEETFEKDEIFGSIETVEEVFDLIMPVSGKIVAVNEKVLDDVDVLNEDPYDDGWLVDVELLNPEELEELLPPEDYEMKFLEEIEEIPEEKIVEEEEE